MKGLLTAVVGLLSAIGVGQDLIGSNKNAWEVSPARVVSNSVVDDFEFNKSGTKIILYRHEPVSLMKAEGETSAQREMFIYDCKTGQSSRIVIPGVTEPVEINLMGDDDSIFYYGKNNPKIQGFYRIASRRLTPTQFDLNTLRYFGDSIHCPYLVQENDDFSISLIDANGSRKSIKFKEGLHVMYPVSADASTYTFVGIAKNTPEPKFRMIKISKSSGESLARAITREEMLALAKEEENGFVLEPTQHSINLSVGSEKEKVTTLLSRSLFICPRSQKIRMNPMASTVAYTDAGALLVRTIVKVDFEKANVLAKNTAKMKSLMAAKQVGLALILFASDNDDVLPGGEGLTYRVLPYLEDTQMLNNFTYTFKGGSMNSIENLAETELGFVVGPGGRAIVYADGHAKWKSDT